MDEQVVVRQKDAEAGMGMVPAHDVEVGKEPVALAGDFFPRVVRVGEAGLGVGVVLGLERLGDPDERARRWPRRRTPCPAGCLPARRRCRRGRGARWRRPRGDRGRSAGRPGPGPGRPGRRSARSRSGRSSRTGSRYLISSKTISSPLTGLSPHPASRPSRSPARRKNLDPEPPSTRTIS